MAIASIEHAAPAVDVWTPSLNDFADQLMSHHPCARSELVGSFLKTWEFRPSEVSLLFIGDYGRPFEKVLALGPNGELPSGEAIWHAYSEGAQGAKWSADAEARFRRAQAER